MKPKFGYTKCAKIVASLYVISLIQNDSSNYSTKVSLEKRNIEFPQTMCDEICCAMVTH
jgi:hypothetical protein